MRTVKRWISAATFAGLIAATTLSCARPKPVPTLTAAAESWCPDGFEVGPQDTCFAVPELTTKDTPVLVYLHGMYAGHGSTHEWALVHSVVQRGFAVVVPRGKRGLCAWKEELKDHFCWPQETEDPQAFKNVVAEWDRVLWQVDAIMEGGPHKRYVLGFSNGASFAAHLATQGMFPAQGYAIINGGSFGRSTKPPNAVPLLLVSATDAEEALKMKDLHEGLVKQGWLHAFCTRRGQPELSADDVAASLAFFMREAQASPKPSGAGALTCEGGTAFAPEAASSSPSPKPKR